MLTGRVAEATTSAANRAKSADTFVRWDSLLSQAQAALLSGRSAEAFGFLEAATKSQPANPQTAIPRFLMSALLLDLDGRRRRWSRPKNHFSSPTASSPRGPARITARSRSRVWAAQTRRRRPSQRCRRARMHCPAIAKSAECTGPEDCWRPSDATVRARSKSCGSPKRRCRRAGSPVRRRRIMCRSGSIWRRRAWQPATWRRRNSASSASFDSTEWLAFSVQYVRSLYFLGQIAEKRGDLPKARAFYQRFVDAGQWRYRSREGGRSPQKMDNWPQAAQNHLPK